MDAWKRTYSNNDTIPVALDYFWEKFDKEGYSLWFSDYLYPEDFAMDFQACNLIGGKIFFLDHYSKESHYF